MMGYAELISKLEALPRDKRNEVFDFIDFLSMRCEVPADKPPIRAQWTDAEFSELSMRQAMRGMEEESVSYTRDDLRERWK